MGPQPELGELFSDVVVDVVLNLVDQIKRPARLCPDFGLSSGRDVRPNDRNVRADGTDVVVARSAQAYGFPTPQDGLDVVPALEADLAEFEENRHGLSVVSGVAGV